MRSKYEGPVFKNSVYFNCFCYFSFSGSIRQGDEGDGLYLIQDGICTANVEKSGQVHTVARLKGGDIFGEMAILTGEPRSSHVDAETDMSLWYLNRESFNSIAYRFPEMREFFTALLAHWIEERPLTANRAVGRYTICRSLRYLSGAVFDSKQQGGGTVFLPRRQPAGQTQRTGARDN